MNQLNKVLTLSSAVILFAALGLWFSNGTSSNAAQVSGDCCCESCLCDNCDGNCVPDCDCCCVTGSCSDDCCGEDCQNCTADCCVSNSCCADTVASTEIGNRN